MLLRHPPAHGWPPLSQIKSKLLMPAVAGSPTGWHTIRDCVTHQWEESVGKEFVYHCSLATPSGDCVNLAVDCDVKRSSQAKLSHTPNRDQSLTKILGTDFIVGYTGKGQAGANQITKDKAVCEGEQAEVRILGRQCSRAGDAWSRDSRRSGREVRLSGTGGWTGLAKAGRSRQKAGWGTRRRTGTAGHRNGTRDQQVVQDRGRNKAGAGMGAGNRTTNRNRG